MPTSSATELSPRDVFKDLPKEVRLRRLARISTAEAERLETTWRGWAARPSQELPGPAANPRTPDGSWVVWMPLAGRGWGKTRVGAETVRIWVKDFSLVNLIGATADDARDIMIEGESGILAVCPRDERPTYVPSKRRLEWPNGARSLIFTADEPERLRGKQHEKLWGDEIAAWRYAAAWDQASLGLRLGANPQALLTTTPRPTALMKTILADPTTLITRGSTYDNARNLAPTFLGKILTKYEGTRLGRQEINAEMLEDNPGALWTWKNIDDHRVEKMPDLAQIGVGVDPAVTSNADSDDTGIVIAGRDTQNPPHFYVFDDLTLKGSPLTWAAEAVRGYNLHEADRIVAEVNNGGDLVETVIRGVDVNVSYASVHATRGKAIRAEPIAALYEQGRVHHVGAFKELEDEMTSFDPAVPGKSPDRMDALVWVLTWLSSEMDGSGIFEFYRQEAERLRKLKEEGKG